MVTQCLAVGAQSHQPLGSGVLSVWAAVEDGKGGQGGAVAAFLKSWGLLGTSSREEQFRDLETWGLE